MRQIKNKMIFLKHGRSFFCLGGERLSRSVLHHASGDYRDIAAPCSLCRFPGRLGALSIARKVFSEVG